MTLVLTLSSHSFASEKYTANECFEKLSRGTLKFNQALDKAIFKPIAAATNIHAVDILKRF